MKRKRIRKKLSTFFANVFSLMVTPLFVISTKLPRLIIIFLGELFADLFWKIGIPWKKMAINNLMLVYRDTLTKKELRKIAKVSMKNIFRMFWEGPIIYKPPYTLIKSTPIEGEEYLTRALEQGNGVLALGNHIGHFPLLLCVLTGKGYPVSFVYKEPKNQSVRRLTTKIMKDLHLDTIPLKPRHVVIKRSLETLRKNGILWIALDQNARGGGEIGVEFFGKKVATAKGPAVLSMRTGAVVIPFYAKRNGWFKHTVVIEEPVILDSTDNREQDAYTNTLKFNAIIERLILKNPTEWWWVHNRWKKAQRYVEEDVTESDISQDND